MVPLAALLVGPVGCSEDRMTLIGAEGLGLDTPHWSALGWGRYLEKEGT